MATNVTFTSLISDLQTYLERGGSATTDPTVYNQLPRLVNAAERKLAQMLKLLGQIETMTLNGGLQAGVSVIAKPDRWRLTVSMNYGTGATKTSRTPIFPRSLEVCRLYWPDPSVTSPPQYYADYDINHWLIVPTPDQAYPAEIIAYMQPPLLDDANQTNFFSELAPNALLYGALLEATPFLKNDPRIATWQADWERELKFLTAQDIQRMIDRAAIRSAP